MDFKIRYFGSSGTQVIEYVMFFMSTEAVKRHLMRDLVHYHPIYYNAGLWAVHSNGEDVLVGHFKSNIVVSEIV